MERERKQPQRRSPEGCEPEHSGDSLDQMRDQLQSAYDAVNNVMSSISPAEAEHYLQQNRQRGGQ